MLPVSAGHERLTGSTCLSVDDEGLDGHRDRPRSPLTTGNHVVHDQPRHRQRQEVGNNGARKGVSVPPGSKITDPQIAGDEGQERHGDDGRRHSADGIVHRQTVSPLTSPMQSRLFLRSCWEVINDRSSSSTLGVLTPPAPISQVRLPRSVWRQGTSGTPPPRRRAAPRIPPRSPLPHATRWSARGLVCPLGNTPGETGCGLGEASGGRNRRASPGDVGTRPGVIPDHRTLYPGSTGRDPPGTGVVAFGPSGSTTRPESAARMPLGPPPVPRKTIAGQDSTMKLRL